MFERYITDALTTHFGHIVESVDADKMQLSAWKGELELHDVSLKSDALDNILQQECPIEIAFGYIGTFQVKIPWSLLSAQFLSWQKDSSSSEPRLLESSACSIILSDVDILITPRRKVPMEATKMTTVDNNNDDDDDDNQTDNETDNDAADNEQQRRVEKEREVQSLLDANLLKRVTESSVSSARWTWLQSWISSVLSTLSVTIRNIHIRYEDPGTSMGFQWKIHHTEYGNNIHNPQRPSIRQQRYRPAFAVGITLKEFSVQSVPKSSVKRATVGFITSSRIDTKETVHTQEVESTTRNEEDDATTTVSSKLSTSTGGERPQEDGETTTGAQQAGYPRLPFVERYKLAAAEHLAIYWDSDSYLVCDRITHNIHQHPTGTLDEKQRLARLYRELFATLNDGRDSQLPGLNDADGRSQYYHLHRQKHSYLLEPVSPSVHLTLVSTTSTETKTSQQEDQAEQGAPESSKSTSKLDSNDVHACPPSSVQIDLPPCKFTFSRSTLEDGVYLRKSHSVWTESSRTLLSEETLHRLARLRPALSPLEDPSSWWRYSFEATKALIRVEQLNRDNNSTSRNQKSNRNKSANELDLPPPLTRRKGWFGLVQAVSRRRKYVRLYEEFIKASMNNDSSSERDIHLKLLAMEDDLLPDEIVSFRMHVYEILSNKSSSQSTDEPLDASESDALIREHELLQRPSDEDILSVRHRHWMMNEMKMALDRERANKENQAAEQDQILSEFAIRHGKANPVVWASSLVCRELAIQINDQVSNNIHSGKLRNSTPVVRMSSAIVQDQSWNKDGSWVSSWSIASLEVKDLVSSRLKGSAQTPFSTLLGKKSTSASLDMDEYIVINGIRYHRDISVTVNKRLDWGSYQQQFHGGKVDRGSTTTTLIRVLPMEIVYSTLPVEALTRVVATVRTPEIVDDYHKILAAANSWREEQKRKLIDALAHKNKKIIVDIDVGAPELLIPEDINRYNSPMLTIDLGRIQAYNDDDAMSGGRRDEFDDQWRIRISDMKVQSTSVSNYYAASRLGRTISSADIQEPQQLVEAFSIEFVVLTKITSEDGIKSGEASKIRVSATLPRLAFNLTSSSIYLSSRLRENWKRRKSEMERFDLRPTNAPTTRYLQSGKDIVGKETSNNNSNETRVRESKTDKNVKSARTFLFEFSAPLITLKLENDMNKIIGATSLFDLAIDGISGRFLQDIGRNGASCTRFNASLQSLGVIDLFQTAGKDFVLLMSSVPQVVLIDDIKQGQSYSWDSIRANYDSKDTGLQRKALVTIEYVNEVNSFLDPSGETVTERAPAQISIYFHELYVEWNPETLAAIQQAIATPIDSKPPKSKQSLRDEDSLDSADEFFDALEELDEQGSEGEGDHSLSEISSSSGDLAIFKTSSSPPRSTIRGGLFSERLSSPARLSLSSAPGSPFTSGLTYFDTGPFGSLSNVEITEETAKPRMIRIVFELAKLRVSFNKETRHRKLMVAQMDRTFVSYSTKVTGGSNTAVRIGNLVFIDPVHEEKKTLYGHILGLKNDVPNGTDPFSLLEMDIILNPKSRQFSSILDGTASDSVTIDRHEGEMTGSDCCVTATLSPMRFVMIQQLWLEIIDYFFQGVIGTEVVGGGKTETSPALNRTVPQTSFAQRSAFLPGSDATGVSFTRFHISLESPVILLPVTYASPEFIRLDLSKIVLANKFIGRVVCDEGFGIDGCSAHRMQWFNTCNISLETLRLFSWSGIELGKEPSSGSVQLKWPSGPLSHLILPKWDVTCVFEELDLLSRRSDYALLQNIISYNVGEPSRYMDEWTALQNLPAGALERFMKKIIVHYGYDKKDVAPSTYHMSICAASLKFSLVDNQKASTMPLATARCFGLRFDMSKGADLVVKQNLCCDIDLVTPSGTKALEFDKLLSISKDGLDLGIMDISNDDVKSGLMYSSVTTRTKESVRSIEIADACINILIPKWKKFAAFFKSLPPPILLSENDIGASIQVGDRWYRIGDGVSSPLASSEASVDKRDTGRFSWINNGGLAGNNNSTQSRRSSLFSAVENSDAYSPKSQLRILLTWPRIVLSSKNSDGPASRVILRMSHLDFLQSNSEKSCSVEKSLFLHDVEVYTSPDHLPFESTQSQQDNSLIRPWNIVLAIRACNGSKIGNCNRHEYRLSADVLRARAAYSDMAIAMDVILSVLYSAKEEPRSGSEEQALEPVFTAGSYDSLDVSSFGPVEDSDLDDAIYCKTPATILYDLQCDGFQLQVADDSGRHFVGSQDLVIFSLGAILFSRRDHETGVSEMKFLLKNLGLVDCLQPINSRFRMAASSQAPSTSFDSTVTNVERKMSWENFGSLSSNLFFYESSEDFNNRVKGASAECLLQFWNAAGRVPTSGLLEIECMFTGIHQEFRIKLRSLVVQWNPSTVIAVQRFLGRLRKESKLVAVQLNEMLESRGNDKWQASSETIGEQSLPKSVVTIEVRIHSLKVCLNKEHQYRRLLELTFTDFNGRLHTSDEEMAIEGSIGDLLAYDTDEYFLGTSESSKITESNRNILSVVRVLNEERDNAFLHVAYQQFPKGRALQKRADAPAWAKSQASSPDDIDDVLSVEVATIRFTYLKERTEEILDYLSNGLPGKGMGATSRAAKGFIKRRIQTKSFLQIQVISPQVFVPQYEKENQGLAFQLGDVTVRSWFEDVTSTEDNNGDSEWWRVLSLKLSGFLSGITRSGPDYVALSSAMKPVDLEVLLRKPTVWGKPTSVKGKLSSFVTCLNYSDYALLRAVLRDNVGRRIDKEKWDNVEKAYWMESSDGILEKEAEATKPREGRVNRVQYASDARFVRYGKAGKTVRVVREDSAGTRKDIGANIGSSIQKTLDLRFDLAGLSIELRRDDLVAGISPEDEIASAFHYNVMLLKVEAVEVLATSNELGDSSLNLSLFRLGLFDLGDEGRLTRERYYFSLPDEELDRLGMKRKNLRKPCPFRVLVEGYDASEDKADEPSPTTAGPQFVTSIDICPASSTTGFGSISESGLPPDSKVTVARIVINHLSVNALPDTVVTDDNIPKASGSGFELKLVAHYPKVFFLADESDLHSRALVLRGLAVINVTDVAKVQAVGRGSSDSVDKQHIISVDAQLHGLETYINPDVNAALRFSRRHVEMVGHEQFPNFTIGDDSVSLGHSDLLGVALIQPVTMGIEYVQIERELFPTRRSLVINIEPVSTMLSFEDLQLVEVVLKRWTSKGSGRSRNANSSQPSFSFNGSNERYEVQFQEARLGLGLKTEGNNVIVSSFQNERHSHLIHPGDIMISVDGDIVVGKQLKDVVRFLSKAKRPVTVIFGRSVSPKLTNFPASDPVTPGSLLDPHPTADPHSRNENDYFSCFVYGLQFHLGVSLGLEFEESTCRRFPVVSKILPTIDEAAIVPSSFGASHSEQIEIVEPMFDPETVRFPKVGAVVVAIDDVPIDEIGVDEAWKLLSQTQQLFQEGIVASGTTFHLTFQEIPSELWGYIDRADVSVAGISLAFIDDLNGRDMPLFRGKLSTLECHAERGIGVEAHIIDSSVPTLLSPLEEVSTDDSTVALSPDVVRDIRSESIISLSAIGSFSIEYFHPKVSYWEPLLEPSQMYFLLEKQEGSADSSRPAQVALEISDRLPRNHFVRANIVESISYRESSMVPINVTDAAADVLFQTLGQWKKWRSDLDSEHSDGYSQELESLSSFSMRTHSSVTPDRSTSQSRLAVTNANEIQNDAAQSAAQAALNFAKKRGAETTTNRDFSKPFVLRNRTGICIAFVQQRKGVRGNGHPKRRFESRNRVEALGDYKGLEGYDQFAITELPDQEDAKFDMDVIDGQSPQDASFRLNARGNKVRNYEGRYPNLTIAAQAVAGVVIEPLTNLQVFKVGSTSCDLIVKKESGDFGGTIHSFPVMWTVEIEDNRRILTLSSAVRLFSSVLAIPIEIGVRKRPPNSPGSKEVYADIPKTTSVGFATSHDPFYIPLWLALKFEPLEIFVRPVINHGREFQWSKREILQFLPATDSIEASATVTKFQKWAWKHCSRENSFVQCDSDDPERRNSVWFFVFRSTPFSGGFSPAELSERYSKLPRRISEIESAGLLSLNLDSCLTIRNMLPIDITWEISYRSNATPHQSINEASSYLKSPSGKELTNSRSDHLRSGECTEVPECNHNMFTPTARFKQINGHFWSNWADLKLHEAQVGLDDFEISEALDPAETLLPSSTQVNVAIADRSFGTPLTLGVRIVPKMTTDEPISGRCYGLEVIVYAEFWIRNISSLPLNFGCPSQQLHKKSGAMQTINSSIDESIARFTAESALMEIASLLEVGDKGTGLNQRSTREIAECGAIESLPQQEAPTLVEEVFEYVEIDGSVVKRRWWAAESFDSYRQNITTVQDEEMSWKWLDSWAIDTSGEAKPSVDGWESCRNILAGDGSFTGKRTFNPSHGFRRRRFFRTRTGTGRYSPVAQASVLKRDVTTEKEPPGSFGSIQAFHQPLNDSFSKEQTRIRRNEKRVLSADSNGGTGLTSDVPVKISVKCADGKWSSPITVPENGTSYGIVKVLATRWPHLMPEKENKSLSGVVVKRKENFSQNVFFRTGCLAPDLFELCYVVSDAEGDWGEFSRTIEISPRFVLRNDSATLCLKIKQVGAPDSSCLDLLPGQASPFYWADFRLPRLVSVKPAEVSDPEGGDYKWSGGFDLCNLGMTPIRIRQSKNGCSPVINSIRSLVEVRPGTGGTGINVSLKEEKTTGEESLFRIENTTPFPIWLEQDGMLANPTARSQHAQAKAKKEYFEPSIDGDLIPPQSKMTFALDIPYRQGKYSNRKEATLSELLHVRVALAPLSNRFAVEMVKVIGLTEVGETIRMNPSKLPLNLPTDLRDALRPIRVLGVVASDGPTRVLKFCLMTYSEGDVFRKNFGEISYYAQSLSGKDDPIISFDGKDVTALISQGAQDAIDLSRSETIPNEIDAKRRALFSNFSGIESKHEGITSNAVDTIFSVRAEFSGFIFSLVDSAPSEIAVLSCRNVNALTRWNKFRTADASVLLSIGWLQVDNHVPSAPFKVAVRPDTSNKQRLDRQNDTESEQTGPSPLLVIAMAFAPKHKSKIMVLRSVTVAPRDLVIALDLAFLVRVQRFLMGLQEHAQKARLQSNVDGKGAVSTHADDKVRIQLPTFLTPEKQLDTIAAFSENQKLYFQGLTILPTNIKLSVAPARALTTEQASLEGKQTAAIHEAVRKGDVLVGNSSSGPLGVRVGTKNKTPIAVVRGMLKSIVVDAILRLDGASLNFPGVFLRNHIATGSQLKTLLLAHYVSSLKNNVPALLGSLAAIGNPIGLIRGIGDGMSDFVTEPVKGFKRSLKELDPGYVVDGVARGTESLARHTVGGLADSASLLMETFAKYMAVVTLDRRYAQKRDRRRSLRNRNETKVTLAGGVESGFSKLVQGFREGVTGVVRAPIRGAEKNGFEGFAKGLGKGLLGLLMKPIIGLTDAAADVMIGVKSTVEYKEEHQQSLALLKNQLRPRRPMYGRDKVLRPYRLEDAAAATLMLRTRCAGENYLSHLDMNDRVALLSVKRLVILGPQGEEQLALQFKHVDRLEVRSIKQEDGSDGWGIVVLLNTSRRNGSDIEVISCHTEQEAITLCSLIQNGVDLQIADDIVSS
ncbi:vacuolar-sorting-associated protein 13 C-terminal domain containing protein [Nitzschia inconspicua]|uniref:Vacuolar-sorting-associated protein 13 C-terminal domain containing protein n=1 Tax=Nitzschia inconspicua TaxID=303405 RepID=A0A9K3KMX3_9STRA|nr:vacuolar-sorting-associated protein 13 C-terminal domain containing protein [Nitzschia inconspicua]